MCVAIPGEVLDADPENALATVRFSPDRTVLVSLVMLPEVEVGDYVVVHSGYAISRVTRDAAIETLRLIGE